MRVDYSPQGRPEASSAAHITVRGDSTTAAAPLGAVAAAGGGFILKRKNRNAIACNLPPAAQSEDAQQSR